MTNQLLQIQLRQAGLQKSLEALYDAFPEEEIDAILQYKSGRVDKKQPVKDSPGRPSIDWTRDAFIFSIIDLMQMGDVLQHDKKPHVAALTRHLREKKVLYSLKGGGPGLDEPEFLNVSVIKIFGPVDRLI